jgi:hypothetical protein
MGIYPPARRFGMDARIVLTGLFSRLPPSHDAA